MLLLAPRTTDMMRIAVALVPLIGLLTSRSITDKDGRETSRVDINLKVDLNMRF